MRVLLLLTSGDHQSPPSRQEGAVHAEVGTKKWKRFLRAACRVPRTA